MRRWIFIYANGEKINRMVHYAILISIALVLSLTEKWLPLSLIVPLPGIKIGLANIVSMFALFYFGWRGAILITVARCLLASIFYGGLIALALSLSGGLFALLIMELLKKGHGKWFSLIGVSIGGAAAHNFGQVAMASLLMNSIAVFYYLAILMITAVITGVLTGTIAQYLFLRLERIGFWRDALN